MVRRRWHRWRHENRLMLAHWHRYSGFFGRDMNVR